MGCKCENCGCGKKKPPSIEEQGKIRGWVPLGRGERIVNGRVMYSAAWLDDAGQ